MFGTGRLLRRRLRTLAAALCLTVFVTVGINASPAWADFEYNVELDAPLDPSDLVRFVNMGAWHNGVFSDTAKRVLLDDEKYVRDIDPNLYDDVRDLNFDGSVTLTDDQQGLRVFIPTLELQSRSESFWEQGSGVAIGLLIAGLARAACMRSADTYLPVATYPSVTEVKRKTFCATLMSMVGSIIGAAFYGVFKHLDVTSTDIARVAMTTGVTAIMGPFLWESGLDYKGWDLICAIVVSVLRGIVTGLVWVWQHGTPYAVAAWQAVASLFSSATDQVAQNVELGQVQPPTKRSAPDNLPCEVYGGYGTPCEAAHSTTRALYTGYAGPLYQVKRASDSATADIFPLEAGGYADASQQDTFCANTSCVISVVYDQSPNLNDLTVEGAGSAAGADHAADAAALPVTAGGHKVYGIYIGGQTGYRNNATTGIAVDSQAEGMYMVASGTHVNKGCCFDYGNAETNTADNGNGHMDTVNLSTTCYFPPCTGSGPWVQADMENGLFMGGNGSNLANTGNKTNFVTALLKNDGRTTYALKGGDSQTGGLTTWWDGHLPNDKPGYMPMHQEGAIVLGTGGDNSNWSVGSFFEGVMTEGYPDDAADDLVQVGIVAAGYDGNSGGVATGASAAAGQAVIHDGYSSVFTVNSANGHLQETYLPKMGDPWSTQDLSAKYGTPVVAAGTKPVTLTHDGYTSVFTVDAGSGHIQETYLPKMGDPWSTQDLSANYGAPATSWTPTALVHDGYTSVWSVNASNGHLQETYLPKMGDPWSTQDLSAKYGTPQAQAGSSPVAVLHTGYTSVFTLDTNHDLQETYLPAMGDPWSTQDLSANYGTPKSSVTPTAVVHEGYTSVYTVDDGTSHLQETYLPRMGDPWHSQDLSANYGTPWVAPGTQPVAFVHTGYTSLYTVDGGSLHLQETYLPAVGDPWTTQDLSAKYGTPVTDDSPVVLLHPDAAGSVTWSSIYTVDQFNLHLQETYLPAIGDPWTTQDLSAKYGTPAVAATQFAASSWSVIHDGYTSAFTVDSGTNHLQETYLPTMGQPWATQDLSDKYGTPAVLDGTAAATLTHDGYTSAYTIDKSNGHLQETYLTAMGQPWRTQDLSAQFGTPASSVAPTAVYHTGYTSVYTVDSSTGHLWETYLPAIGGPWHSQDLSANYGTPSVKSGASPVAVMHSGWTSVYTLNSSNWHLQETYLPAIGDPWTTQDLSATYGTPASGVTPAVLVHDGFTSLYTVDSNHDLQETYLPAIGDDWVTQDLSAKYGTPAVASGLGPVALFHTGYASVYTIDQSGNHVQETYLPAIGDNWASQDLSANYGTPAANQAPSVLIHGDTTGALTWTSIFTVTASNLHLQETYLPKIGDPWNTQDLSANYGTPPV